MEEIVNNLNNEPHGESDDAYDQNEENATTITPPTWGELDGIMETLSKLNLYTDLIRFWSIAVKIIRKDPSK